MVVLVFPRLVAKWIILFNKQVFVSFSHFIDEI